MTARTVRTARLSLELDPERGGRILSLADMITGREWLVQPSPPGADDASYGESFTDRLIYGWDEMLPTIDPCEVEGVRLPDHGEIWAVPWTPAEAGHQGGVRLEVTGRCLPLTLSREIWPNGDRIVLDYVLTNHGRQRLPALWAAHPQFRLAAQTTADLGPGPSHARIASPAERSPTDWAAIVRRAAELPTGTHLKVWLEGVNRPSILRLRDNLSGLAVRWAGDCIRGVAVLWDNAQFSTERVLAVEPSTGCHDSLATAVAAGDATVLDPGDALRWSVVIEAT